MKNSLHVHQSNNHPNPQETVSQINSYSFQNNQDFFCFLRCEENSINPRRPSFSKNGLSQDIIKVTEAEPDICLEVFYALYNTLWPQIEKQPDIFLKDAWMNFIGNAISKGILCPPEKLLGKKKPQDIKRILSDNQGEQLIFQDLDVVLKSILHLKKKLIDHSGKLLQKKDILDSLDLIEGFYQQYRDKVKALVQALIEASSVPEYEASMNALVDLLEPKAVIMSDIFLCHWAYRTSRSKAQKLLSLNEEGQPIRNNSYGSSNHRVAALPEGKEPLVYFKANGDKPVQPEKEYMIYSLYKQLQIPIPETALLVLTDVLEKNSGYLYAVQASEAVTGTPACQTSEMNFNQEAYTSQVIGAILTNPSDGSFKNFQYSPKYRTLISIDNDLIFEPELLQDDRKIVNIKSILYLFPQLDNAIPESIKILFTSLDLYLVIFSWLKDLSQKNQDYSLLFTRLAFSKTRFIYQNLLLSSDTPSLALCLRQQVLVDPDLHQHSFYPQILVSENLLSNISEKLQIIEKTLLHNYSATPQTLLENASPIIGKYYHRLRAKFPNPEEAIEAVWGIQKDRVDYSEISSLLFPEELSGFLHKSTEILKPPEMFLNDFKNKLASEKTLPLDKFIQRHSKRKYLLNLSQALNELQLLIQEGLIDSHSPQDIVDFCYDISKMIDRDGHLAKEITALFFNLPHPELRWLFTLDSYFSSDVPEELRSSSVPVTGAFMKQRIFTLTESQQSYLFNEQGNIKKNASLTGRSSVTCFPETNPEFYLKQHPEFPGYEFASSLFMRLLGIKHLPYHDLIVIENSYPVLLSQKVEGSPVHQVWDKPQAFRNLDPFHTGLLIIAAILLNPEDGKEDNFILSADGKYLIPIDHDHCFLPSTFQKGTFFNIIVNIALQTKTLLFCLDEMNKPVPLEVKQHVLETDFDLLLRSWLQELVKAEERYHHLADQEQRGVFIENGTVLRIPFYEEFIRNLYWKVNKIQHLLMSPSEQTPLSLLKAVEPFAARCYEKALNSRKTLQSRFKSATNQLYLETMNGSQTSVLNTQIMMKIINISATDLQNDTTDKKMGPSGALKTLEKLIQEQDKNRKLEQDLLCELDEQHEESLWTFLFGNPLLESALDEFFAYPKEGLVLKGSRLIAFDNLTNLLTKTPDSGAKIKFLSLPNSPLLERRTFKALVDGCPNLEYLNVSGCLKLKEILTTKEEWPLLTRFEANDCVNLKKFVSHSPIKILRIGTNQNIEILLKKHILEIFTLSTQTNQFDFLLEKGDNFEIKPLQENDNFLQSATFKKEVFEKYFRKPKITIGSCPILSPKDLESFITSINLANSGRNNEQVKDLTRFRFMSLKVSNYPSAK